MTLAGQGCPTDAPYTLLRHRTSDIFGLGAIGDQFEGPFGHDENDLPTPLEPVDYVLT